MKEQNRRVCSPSNNLLSINDSSKEKKSTPKSVRRHFTSPINRASLRPSCQVAKTNIQMETKRGVAFDCSPSSPSPMDRWYSRVFSKTNTRWLAVGRGKFNLTGAMREHGRTNKENGARKETVFYARGFSCPNNYKEGCVRLRARATSCI